MSQQVSVARRPLQQLERPLEHWLRRCRLTELAIFSCLQDADATLEAHIHQMTSCIKAMTEAAANKPHFYVTDEDIVSLPCFK
jgi:hypothetical protein